MLFGCPTSKRDLFAEHAASAVLARWTDRDLHDVGLSWSDIASGVEKPFWRA
jgi:hypothetical protein